MSRPPRETDESSADSESERDAGDRSWTRQVLFIGAFVLLGSTVLVPLAGPNPIAVGGILVLLVAIALLWLSAGRRSSGASETETDTDDSSVWNAIPSWQYSGRHVESGGLARGEQEQALADIQQQVDEIEAEEEDR